MSSKYKNGSSIVAIIVTIGIMCLVLLFVFAIASSAAGMVQKREPSPGASSGTKCSTWLNAPPLYQNSIQDAAAKQGIHSALLGAIFLSEHNDTWPSFGSEEYKTRILPAHPTDFQQYSPFQFTSAAWKDYSGGASEEDMMDFEIGAAAAAKYISTMLKSKGIPLDTQEEKYITFVGMYYNRGPKAALEWADNGYDLANPPENTTNPGWEWGANDYAKRTWANFQNLNVGCTTIASSNEVVQVALAEIATFRNDCNKFNGCDSNPWCSSFVSWVFNKSGYDIGTHPSAEGLRKYFIDNQGTTTIYSIPAVTQIQPGDVLFYKSDESGVTHHVGIAIAPQVGNEVRTIHGNAGHYYKDGVRYDQVKEEKYDISKVMGIGRMK